MWDYLKLAKKPIVIYGMGNGADKIINILNKMNISFSGVFASDDFVRGQNFHSFEVLTYSKAKEKFGDMIVLVAFGTQRPEIIQRIKDIALEQELYAPDVPVIGDVLFDNAFAQRHSSKLQAVIDLLQDEKSRKVFDNIVNYKLSGKIDFLFNSETSIDEAYENILKLNNNETFMDLGAYTGDTVSEFLSYVNGYNKIFAVEPDNKNFIRLQKNTQNYKNIELFNLGIHSDKQTLFFNKAGGRNSKLSKDGKPIEVDSVDNILSGEQVTFIKMDIEGQEANAIDGAKNTILKYKPKMQISCYHKSEDIFDLPLRIAAIRNDYKLYMRHYPYIPAWDTNFYFV